jgi:hypothetical protein
MPKKLILGLALLCAARAWADDAPPAREDAGAHFQATYINQRKPAFSADYSGPNSLSPDAERSYTLTADADLGLRPWKGGELYLDLELTQGLPFSDLVGLAGFPNGELSRVSGREPTIYRQRLFLRQTWNRGGGSQAVESDANQLAGSVDRNRFVLTAGNLSVLDIFDNNAYAHDPRQQFMNWSQMTHTAYDYAADARGFTLGVSGEWYQDDWVLRFGRMAVPLEPNGQELDSRIFKHYGDQVEFERGYHLIGQDGRLRLLGWRNRGLLASFDDALALGAATGQVPDINAVRTGTRTKYGMGINVEQPFSATAGGFVRAMWADGHSETQAFTEADRSLATGVAVKGDGWGRAQDTLGISLARNFLSDSRRRYLEAGGISFFIGDGALNYRPEDILEAYYSVGVAKGFWISADAQLIANPAYNADRGPVVVWGVRLHAEF